MFPGSRLPPVSFFARRLHFGQVPHMQVTGLPPFLPPLGFTRRAALRRARSERSTSSGIVAGSMLSVHILLTRTPPNQNAIAPPSSEPLDARFLKGGLERIGSDPRLDLMVGVKQNDRRNHSDAPLTRAVRERVSQQIEEYCAELACRFELLMNS